MKHAKCVSRKTSPAMPHAASSATKSQPKIASTTSLQQDCLEHMREAQARECDARCPRKAVALDACCNDAGMESCQGRGFVGNHLRDGQECQAIKVDDNNGPKATVASSSLHATPIAGKLSSHCGDATVWSGRTSSRLAAATSKATLRPRWPREKEELQSAL